MAPPLPSAVEPPPNISLPHLVRWTAPVSLVLLFLAGAVLASRRLAGVLQPLAVAPTLVAGLAIAGLGALAQVSVWSDQRSREQPIRQPRTMKAVSSVAIVILAVSLSFPLAATGATCLLWVLLLVELAVTRWPPVARCLRITGTSARTQRTPAPRSPLPAADVLQQFSRQRTVEGTEMIVGWLRVPLAAGQRSTTAHVPFWPAFSCVPEVAVEKCEGMPARVKPAQVLPYGVRLDIRLAEPSESKSDLVLRITVRANSTDEQSPPAGLPAASE